MSRATLGLIVTISLLLTGLPSSAQTTDEHDHQAPTDSTIVLSAQLGVLLSAEMRAIEAGLGPLMVAIAAGDWPRVVETSTKIETSYILAQQLTAEQREELRRVLPPLFKSLDATFHRAAGKLAEAAEARDAELAVFHSYKLMEACVECHAAYASERFSGFAGGTESHEHH